MIELHVGIIQPATKRLDLEYNYQKCEKLILKAAQKGADIICTPECVLDGYSFDMKEFQTNPDRYCMRDDPVDPYYKRFSKLACKLKIHMIIGCSLMQKMDAKEQSVYRNAALLFNPEGKVVGKYFKVHSTYNNLEAKFYKHGENFPVFTIAIDGKDVKIGIMICYDRQVPESARILRLNGAEIIFNPAATGNFRRSWNTNMIKTRAYENRCYIVSVNHAAPRINGRSFAVGVKGRILKRLWYWNSYGILRCNTEDVQDQEHIIETRRPSTYKNLWKNDYKKLKKIN